MLTLYVIAAIVGTSLALASVFFGGDHDSNTDFDHGGVGDDLHGGLDGDHGGGGHGEHSLETTGLWLPFLSLRFWTYFLAVFGVSGSLLMWVGSVGGAAIFALAVTAGIIAGTSMTLAVRLLKRSQAGSGIVNADFEGALGRVLVTVANGHPGKVRCQIRGETIDMVAVTEQEQPIEPGSSIYVLGLDGERVRIATPEWVESRLLDHSRADVSR